MALHVSLKNLIEKRIVESSRLEFKKGFNAKAIFKTVCALANDYQSLGGGYVVIGAAENQGQFDIQNSGLKLSEIDTIQKKLVEYSKKIQPNYAPKITVESYHDKFFILLWCFAGDAGVYTVPEDVTQSKSVRHVYIRDASVTRYGYGSGRNKIWANGELG